VVETRQGARRLTVAGTTSEYTVGGMMLYMDWDRAKELFDVRGVHAYPITAKPGMAARLEAQLQSFCKERGLQCQTNAEFRRHIERAVQGVEGFFWMLVVLTFVVASLGVVNTLTMNVLEQTRETGILRAVAMQRRQVRKLILCQAAALGLVAVLPGCGLGIGLAWLMNLSGREILGQPIPLRIEPGYVLGCLAAGLVTTLVAAWLPARRAAMQPILPALQFE
jgi:putative ABC transport system permease protein